jgi:hypothetical protein
MFRFTQKAKTASTASNNSENITLAGHQAMQQQRSPPTSCLGVGIHILISKNVVLQQAQHA